MYKLASGSIITKKFLMKILALLTFKIVIKLFKNKLIMLMPEISQLMPNKLISLLRQKAQYIKKSHK